MSKKDKSEELNEEQLVDAPEVLETADAKGSGSAAEELNREVDELKDKYLRLRAEFDNFKKRTIKERIDLMKMAAQDTLTALLPVLDDFDRAKKIVQNGQQDRKSTRLNSSHIALSRMPSSA